LEFYWAYADYRDLIDLTEDLLAKLVVEVTGNDTLTYRGNEISFKRPFARYSMKEAIAHFSDGTVDPNDRAQLVNTVRRNRKEDDRAEVESLNEGKLLAEAFEAIAEEKLIQPTFITDFPTEVSPLSKQ